MVGEMATQALPYVERYAAAIALLFMGFFRTFIEPLLCHLNLMTPNFGDPTYGRSRLPRSQNEKEHIYDDPNVTVTERIVHLKGDAIRKGGSWDRPGSSFIAYSIWQINEAMEREQLNADIVLLHGINGYSGKLAATGKFFTEKGFRVIAIDLPAFGRSSGLHSYLPSLRILVEAAHAVMTDVITKDAVEMRGRKIFMQGESMGGFTALYYAALYPPTPTPGAGSVHNGKNFTDGESTDVSDTARPKLSGVACLAPMLAISAQSRPPAFVEPIARVLAFFAGRLPLVSGVKGNVSDDIRVEHEFHADPMTYKGNIRIATGLAVLTGIADLQTLAPRISVPVAFHHGKNDRATSHLGTQAFAARIGSKEKTFKLWDGYEHIMLKKVNGQSKEDDLKRKAVLDEVLYFFQSQARKAD